jgi:hypothetical protein
MLLKMKKLKNSRKLRKKVSARSKELRRTSLQKSQSRKRKQLSLFKIKR